MKDFNLAKFKKVDVNRDYTIMEDQETGHKIFLKHKAMSLEMQRAIGDLPIQKMSKGGVVKATKMAEGGSVPQPLPGTDQKKKEVSDAFNSATWKRMADGGMVGIQGEELSPADKGALALAQGLVPAGSPSDVGQQLTAGARNPLQAGIPIDPTAVLGPEQTLLTDAPSTSPENVELPSIQTVAPTTSPSGPGPVQQSVNQFQAGVNQEASAQGQIAQDSKAAVDQNMVKQKEYQTKLDDNLKARHEAYNKFQQYIDNPENNVNPQRYMANQGTWGRISTAIGLGLGGAPAQQFLQKQIDDDVAAQKANLNNKQTLYAENMKLLGDEDAATRQTMVMMNQLVESQLKSAALKQGTPLAQAQALKLGAEFAAKNSKALVKEAQYQTDKQMLAARPTGGVSIDRAAQLVSRLPKEARAEAAKEIEQAKGLQSAFTEAKMAYTDLARASAVGNVAGKVLPGGTDSSRKVNLANATIERIIRQNRPKGSGVLTDADAAAIIDPYKLTAADLVNPQAIKDKEAAFGRFLNQMWESSAGTLQTHGIKLAPPIASKLGPKPQGGK